MNHFKLNEQIAAYRKQRGITQDELAKVLGVTNQSVSKWESGACCPDIQILPELADYFGITIDELFGREQTETSRGLADRIRQAFKAAERDCCFDLAYKIAFSAAQGALTGGYRDQVPWDTDKMLNPDFDYDSWGSSIRSEPDGHAVVKKNAVFLSSGQRKPEPSRSMIRNIYQSLRLFESPNALTVFFSLYSLTIGTEDAYASEESIAEHCGLPVSDVKKELESLPVEPGTDGGFRIEGNYLYFVPVLSLLTLK